MTKLLEYENNTAVIPLPEPPASDDAWRELAEKVSDPYRQVSNVDLHSRLACAAIKAAALRLEACHSPAKGQGLVMVEAQPLSDHTAAQRVNTGARLILMDMPTAAARTAGVPWPSAAAGATRYWMSNVEFDQNWPGASPP